MLDIPRDMEEAYRRALEVAGVPRVVWGAYRKWLRYYLDFGEARRLADRPPVADSSSGSPEVAPDGIAVRRNRRLPFCDSIAIPAYALADRTPRAASLSIFCPIGQKIDRLGTSQWASSL
jgi:hypothetical protein